MSYVGKWKFQSIGTFDEDSLKFLTADKFLNSSMDYIDTSDEEEVLHELQERKKQIGTIIDVCDDGFMYFLTPLPEDASQEEIDNAVKEGFIKLRDGMMTDSPIKWEERDGEFWCDLALGEDGMSRCSDDDGNIMIMTTKYVKEN